MGWKAKTTKNIKMFFYWLLRKYVFTVIKYYVIIMSIMIFFLILNSVLFLDLNATVTVFNARFPCLHWGTQDSLGNKLF